MRNVNIDILISIRRFWAHWLQICSRNFKSQNGEGKMTASKIKTLSNHMKLIDGKFFGSLIMNPKSKFQN